MGSQSTRYSKIAMGFHWLSAIVVLAAFATGMGGPVERVYSETRLFDRQLHETLGLAVFLLTLLRVLWKLLDRRPEPVAMPSWMERSAHIMQRVLYLLLIFVPVTAVLGAALTGHQLDFLGGASWAPIVSPMPSLGGIITEIHPLLGDAIVWLAGAHAAAGLFHHYILRDGVLSSMLPDAVLLKLPRLGRE